MSLEDLYKFGKLEKHKTSPQEIKDLMGVAERCLKDSAQAAISTDLRFIAAYQAALAAGEALLCCMGYKAPKNNYHFMVWEAMRNTLDDSYRGVLVLFNGARSKRADAFYDRPSVASDTELKELLKEAEKFTAFVKSKIKKDFPEYGKGI
ncbi:MAG: hypothetical protein WC369_01090 [Dehalococcoidales bacterium]|jgi:uncharacterized protein (UPF0332 family)